MYVGSVLVFVYHALLIAFFREDFRPIVLHSEEEDNINQQYSQRIPCIHVYMYTYHALMITLFWEDFWPICCHHSEDEDNINQQAAPSDSNLRLALTANN